MTTDVQHGHAHAGAASDIVGAATKFLDSLSSEQKAKAMIEYTKGERFFWYYPPLNRQGQGRRYYPWRLSATGVPARIRYFES